MTEQARQCLANIEIALNDAGARRNDVVRVHYILPDAKDFESCWPTLREAFKDAAPAATMIEAALATPEVKIEIEVTAFCG